MVDYHPDFDTALQKGKEGQRTGPWPLCLVHVKHPEGRGGMSEVVVVGVVTSIELYLAAGAVWWRHSWNLYVLRGVCLYVHPSQGLKWSTCRFLQLRLGGEGPQMERQSTPVWPSQGKVSLGRTIKAWTCQGWNHEQVVLCIHSRCQGVSWHLFRVIKHFSSVKAAAYS